MSGYLGSWKIDDLLTFVVNTQVFATGVATDADSPPAYRVYEDETGTAILTGSMALLDSSNTAGFYSEQITLSAANGFEKGKCYSIYISATVSSVAGATHRNFQVQAEVAVASINANAITAASIADGAIDANTFAAGAIVAATIADGAIDAATFAANAITSTVIADDAITANKIAANAIGASELAADAVTEIQSGLATSAALAAVAVFVDTEVAAILAAVDTEVAAIKAKTDSLTFTTANRVDSQVFGMEAGTVSAAAVATDAIDGDAIAASAVTEIQSGLATAAALTTISNFVDTEVAAILAAVDTEVAAIKLKTDLIPGTQDGKTYAETLLLMAAVLLGKASGLETNTAVYRAINDIKARVTATVDADGNRSAVTLDAT